MGLSSDSLKANLGNPQRTYLWNVIISNLPGGVGDTETIQLRCQSTSIPGRTVGVLEVPYKQATKLQYPGKIDYSHEWECTFIEGEDAAIFQTFYAWAQAVIDDMTNLGSTEEEIKTDAILQLVSTRDDETLRIRLRGCFVRGIQNAPLSYGSDGNLSLTVIFRYDSWTLES